MTGPQVFVSYCGHDEFEAGLLQFAIETLLRDEKVVAWTYQRDQARSEREIAQSIKNRVRDSCATIFIVSPTTLSRGATQWMELAYADAFDVKTFVLLHHLKYSDLKSAESGVPPLLLAGQCNSATEWRTVIEDIRQLVKESRNDI
jgi:hypothetical protein